MAVEISKISVMNAPYSHLGGRYLLVRKHQPRRLRLFTGSALRTAHRERPALRASSLQRELLDHSSGEGGPLDPAWSVGLGPSVRSLLSQAPPGRPT